MNKSTWVVVADEGIARFLQSNEASGELDDIDELTDAGAHADNADLRRAAHGRRSSGGTSPNASQQNLRGVSSVTASAGEDEKHLEAEGFARRVAQRLDEALQAGRFQELRVAAAPRFLGLLRQALSPQVQRVLSEYLNEDLIHFDNREIKRRLFSGKDVPSELSMSH